MLTFIATNINRFLKNISFWKSYNKYKSIFYWLNLYYIYIIYNIWYIFLFVISINGWLYSAELRLITFNCCYSKERFRLNSQYFFLEMLKTTFTNIFIYIRFLVVRKSYKAFLTFAQSCYTSFIRNSIVAFSCLYFNHQNFHLFWNSHKTFKSVKITKPFKNHVRMINSKSNILTMQYDYT